MVHLLKNAPIASEINTNKDAWAHNVHEKNLAQYVLLVEKVSIYLKHVYRTQLTQVLLDCLLLQDMPTPKHSTATYRIFTTLEVQIKTI